MVSILMIEGKGCRITMRRLDLVPEVLIDVRSRYWRPSWQCYRVGEDFVVFDMQAVGCRKEAVFWATKDILLYTSRTQLICEFEGNGQESAG